MKEEGHPVLEQKEAEPFVHRLGVSRMVQTCYFYFQDGSRLTKVYNDLWTLRYNPLLITRRISKVVGNRNCIVHIAQYLESSTSEGELKKRTRLSYRVKLAARSVRNPLSEMEAEAEGPFNTGIYITTKGQLLAAASNRKEATSSGNKFRREVLKALYHNKRWIVWKRGPSPNAKVARVLKLHRMSGVPDTSYAMHRRFGSVIEDEIERESTISVIAALKRPPRTWLKELDQFCS